MNMEEVRQKFPQYNDLSDGDLAQALHKKYYSDLPFDQFATQIGLSATSPAQQGTKQPGLREAGASLPTAARGFLNAAQGPLFNFADEIAASGAAGIDRFITGRNPGFSFDQLRDRYRDVARGASESYQRESPIVAPLTQAGASMLALGPLGIGGSASGPGGAVLRAAGIGGAQGAIGGAGSAQEVSDIPGEMVRSGAFGALTGGALSAVTQGGGSVLRNMAARSRNTKIGQNAASDLARTRVATGIARDLPEPLTTPENSARAARYASNKLETLGPRAVIADSAGRNTRELLDTMSNMPGRTGNAAEQLLRNRKNLRFSDLETAAARGMNTGGRRLADTVENLVEERTTAAAPLYAQLRQVSVDVDRRLSDVVAASRQLGADKIARTIATARQLPYTLDDDIARGSTRYTMTDLDNLKRGLDDLVSKQIRPDGSVSETGNALMELRRNLLSALDDATTQQGGGSLYRQARDAFAGPTALIDAANSGRRAMTQDAATLTRLTRGMSQSELDAFRVGAFEAVRNKIGTEGGQSEMLKLYSNKNMQERLRVLFPDIRGYNEFKREVTRQIVLRRNEGAVGGSQTASRLARQDDEAAALVEGVAGVASAANNPLGLFAAARRLGTRAAMPEPVRDEIGRLLMQRGPQAQQTLGDLSRYLADINARRGAVANELGLLGGSSINALIGN